MDFWSDVSAGMSEEVEQIGKMRKKIGYFTEELQEVP